MSGCGVTVCCPFYSVAEAEKLIAPETTPDEHVTSEAPAKLSTEVTDAPTSLPLPSKCVVPALLHV